MAIHPDTSIQDHRTASGEPVRWLRHLPILVIGALVLAGLVHGPVAQLANYHDFADQHALFGIPHAKDVVSNLSFALIALWGWIRLSPKRNSPSLSHSWAGYRLFLIGLFLTALGSTFYHLAPDNARLVWDRLPIALACGGLLAAIWSDADRRSSLNRAAWLALAGVTSVAWWHFTELAGRGDLRPYLLLQIAPMLLIPLWQTLHRADSTERLAFGGALLLYVVAKFAELNDHAILMASGFVSGHTLKHLLAAAAAWLIVACLVRRVGERARRGSSPTLTLAAPMGNSQ